MAAAVTTKTAKDGASTPATFPMGFLDVSGTGAGPFVPLHALYDSTGALINPATKEGVAAIATALAGTLAVSAANLPLPAGAATSAKQDGAATILGNILTALGPLATDADLVQGFATVVAKNEAIRALLAGTLAISAAALPLPAGASTSAKQDAAATIFTNILAALNGTLAVSAAALPLPNGAATAAAQGTGNTSLASIDGKVPAKGQAAMAGSLPVAIASDQGALPISAAALPLPTGAATGAKQDTGNTALTQIDTDLTAGLGTDGTTPPSLPGGATGVRGWLRLLSSLLPASLGAKLSAASLSMVPASDAVFTVAGSGGALRVGGTTARVPATFTRPANATAYASGQMVANSTTAGSVTPIALAVARVNGGTAAIPTLKLGKSSTGVTNASFRVHLYRNSPTASNGDGGAWLTTSSVYLGYADVTMDKVFTDEASGTGVLKDSAGNARTLLTDTAAGSQNIYALIEARAAYTPVSAETFTLTAEVLQD